MVGIRFHRRIAADYSGHSGNRFYRSAMTDEELIDAIAELLSTLQVPRSIGLLGSGGFPGARDAWDKVHGELAFGWPSKQDYADALAARFIRD